MLKFLYIVTSLLPRTLISAILLSVIRIREHEELYMDKNFKELGLNDALVSALEKQGIKEPTEVQENTIGDILARHDVIARAETGSGKTLTYLLPIFMNIDTALRSSQCIILTPTHELAVQVHRQAELLAENSGMEVRSALIIGNAGITRQIEKLKEKPHIIIGSAGRIYDLMERGRSLPIR